MVLEWGCSDSRLRRAGPWPGSALPARCLSPRPRLPGRPTAGISPPFVASRLPTAPSRQTGPEAGAAPRFMSCGNTSRFRTRIEGPDRRESHWIARAERFLRLCAIKLRPGVGAAPAPPAPRRTADPNYRLAITLSWPTPPWTSMSARIGSGVVAGRFVAVAGPLEEAAINLVPANHLSDRPGCHDSRRRAAGAARRVR